MEDEPEGPEPEGPEPESPEYSVDDKFRDRRKAVYRARNIPPNPAIPKILQDDQKNAYLRKMRRTNNRVPYGRTQKAWTRRKTIQKWTRILNKCAATRAATFGASLRNKLHTDGLKYTCRSGSRAQVAHRNAEKFRKYTLRQIRFNRRGKYVSRKRSDAGKQSYDDLLEEIRENMLQLPTLQERKEYLENHRFLINQGKLHSDWMDDEGCNRFNRNDCSTAASEFRKDQIDRSRQIVDTNRGLQNLVHMNRAAREGVPPPANDSDILEDDTDIRDQDHHIYLNGDQQDDDDEDDDDGDGDDDDDEDNGDEAGDAGRSASSEELNERDIDTLFTHFGDKASSVKTAKSASVEKPASGERPVSSERTVSGKKPASGERTVSGKKPASGERPASSFRFDPSEDPPFDDDYKGDIDEFLKDTDPFPKESDASAARASPQKQRKAAASAASAASAAADSD